MDRASMFIRVDKKNSTEQSALINGSVDLKVSPHGDCYERVTYERKSRRYTTRVEWRWVYWLVDERWNPTTREWEEGIFEEWGWQAWQSEDLKIRFSRVKKAFGL